MTLHQAKGSDARLPELEVWGGVECSVVRVGNRYRNEVVLTGHHERLDDLDRIAELGIRTLRYPVLWETVSPERPDRADWSWHDERLRRLQELGIEPIVGLVHHGSGPRYVDMLEESYALGLAHHAREVARRYPWLRYFTPVNEPLTTARFSALYGHWYPHKRDEHQFLRAVMQQCKGTVLAMQAIREIIPDAELVQTEDLGKVFSTTHMAYQAEYENERRWLSLDLLCGRVDRFHRMYRPIIDAGFGEEDIAFFAEQGSVIDIIGINHYLTSDRYLDERLELFPPHTHGGNAFERYADTEALRVDLPLDEIGPEARLREAWQRYGLPLAVTEAHNGAGSDDQIRWLMDMWRATRKVRAEGADIRALTVWALFGSVDWNSLLVEERGHYEPGAFHVRDGVAQPTHVAEMVAGLVRSGDWDHPVLQSDGWWRSEMRVHYAVSANEGQYLPYAAE